MTHARGTTNRNNRGSATDRRARKQYLLDQFGDGTTAPCALHVSTNCQEAVTFETITVDRHPIPGCEGGRYTRDNIRPACGPCNQTDGGRLGNERRRSS
jgi:5-methylcytosine-specific restriction endonuclease McrA